MKKTNYGKVLIGFAGGLFVGLSVLMVANAYTIQTSIANAVQYIMRTVVTSNGGNDGTVLVDLNTGTNNDVYIAKKLGIGKVATEMLDVNGTGKFSNSILFGSRGKLYEDTNKIYLVNTNSTGEIYLNGNTISLKNAYGYGFTIGSGGYYGRINTYGNYIYLTGDYLVSLKNAYGYGFTIDYNSTDLNGALVLSDTIKTVECITGAMKFSGDQFFACQNSTSGRQNLKDLY